MHSGPLILTFIVHSRSIYCMNLSWEFSNLYSSIFCGCFMQLTQCRGPAWWLLSMHGTSCAQFIILDQAAHVSLVQVSSNFILWKRCNPSISFQCLRSPSMCGPTFWRCPSGKYGSRRLCITWIDVWSSVLCPHLRTFFLLNTTKWSKRYCFDWHNGMLLQSCDFTLTTPSNSSTKLLSYSGVSCANFGISLAPLLRPWSSHWRPQHDGEKRHTGLIQLYWDHPKPAPHQRLDQSYST